MIELSEILSASILFLWVLILVLFITRKLYVYMRSRGLEHNVAIYYNRKIIHILAGGLCAVSVPILFRTPLVPFIFALALALLTYVPHRVGRLMYWFQVEENSYETSFCIMWGLVISVGWLLSNGNFWIGILPVLFMSIGDAVTGIVRNKLYGRRTKSWWGNLAMAILSIPLGAVLGLAGAIAGAVASIVEHFEFKFIDDNVSIPLVSLVILLIANFYAPWMIYVW